MVLDDATSDTSGFQNDNPPSEAPGEYLPNVSYTSQIDFSTLPQPVPLIGPLLGYGEAYRTRVVQETLVGASKVVKRPLRHEEVQGIAELYNKVIVRQSWGDTIGMAAGATICYQKASTYRFPFWSPNLERFNPNELGPLRGHVARAGWHTCRALGYMALFGVIGDFIFRNSAVMTSLAALQRDPRLKEFNDQLANRMKGALEERDRNRDRQRAGLPPQERRDQGTTGGVGGFSGSGASNAKRRRTDNVDDMSPTGGTFAESFGSASDTSMLSDEQMRVQEARQQAEDSRAANTYQTDKAARQQQQQQTQAQRQRQDSFDFGDASPSSSPTASSQSPQGSRSAERGPPGESAWERIRRQRGMSEQSPPSSPQSGGIQREQRQVSTLGDSFSFSATEEERALAKSEAQKEFDARIERERQGKDFGSEGGRRW